MQFADGSYGVSDLTTEFLPGEITSIIGPSGCGKSSLLRAVAGLIPASSGQITFSPQLFPANRGDLAFVFQEAALIPWRTARENVNLPLELTDTLADPRQPDTLAHYLRSVELDQKDEHKLPAQLSGGMSMRVSIARALVTDPNVLLLDEPFAALDEMLRTRLGELLVTLWQQRQRTVLFVTHNIAEAILLSHRLIILSDGKLHDEFANPLPFPRVASARTTPQFAEFYAEVAAKLAEVSE